MFKIQNLKWKHLFKQVSRILIIVVKGFFKIYCSCFNRQEQGTRTNLRKKKLRSTSIFLQIADYREVYVGFNIKDTFSLHHISWATLLAEKRRDLTAMPFVFLFVRLAKAKGTKFLRCNLLNTQSFKIICKP